MADLDLEYIGFSSGLAPCGFGFTFWASKMSTRLGLIGPLECFTSIIQPLAANCQSPTTPPEKMEHESGFQASHSKAATSTLPLLSAAAAAPAANFIE